MDSLSTLTMDARVARRSSSSSASSSAFLFSESTLSKAWALLFFASSLLPGANGTTPHDHDEERAILLAERATRYSTSAIVHDKYFIPAIVSMGVLFILAAVCCFMLGWCRPSRDRHDAGEATVWRPPLVSQSKSLSFFLCLLRSINLLFVTGRSVNNLNSRPSSRRLSAATSNGTLDRTLDRRSSKRKLPPANGSSPVGPYQPQTPGTYTPMQQSNTNMNEGVAPTHGFQLIQRTQPQFQVPMNVTPSRAGGYYNQQNPRMSELSSATSHTDSTQVGSGQTSPGAAGVGSGYGGGGSYFGTTQQAYPQNYVPSPHSYSQHQPQPQTYSQPQPQPQTYAQSQSHEYTQPEPQPTKNVQGDSRTPMAGQSSSTPAPPSYTNGH